MQTLGIKALKTKPNSLSKAFDSHDTVLITRRGKPIGIAAPFDDRLLELGLTRWIAIRAFQSGDLSLGQVARAFGRSNQAMLPLLADLGIAVADYDLDEDLETICKLNGT